MSRFVEDKLLNGLNKLAVSIFMTFAIATPARAEDTLRLAIGQRGLWNTCISEVGQRGGIFKRHGINLEIHLAGYRETIDWLYAGPVALNVYADFSGITAAKAMRVRDQFFPKSAILPDEVTGLDLIIPDAIEMKFINAAPSQQQLADLIQIPPRK